MSRRLALVLAVAACGGPTPVPSTPTPPAAPTDPDGPHRAQVAAQVQPFLDAEIISGLVVGLYDAGKLEIYGFGAGPGGKPPTGGTLFELGSVTKVYTSLLLADAVQRREVTLDTEVAALLPPGTTVPTKDGTSITLRHLALHSSGLPRMPPSLMQEGNARPSDPYGGYGEDPLYQDLVGTQLEAAPGARVSYSNYGAGLLGHALGRKAGGGYGAALRARVLTPLGLADTHLGFPAGAPRAEGTNEDLQPRPPWTFDALAGAGALVSNARDQLAFLAAQLDAVAGGKGPLRGPMRLTHEVQGQDTGVPSGLGWALDRDGRYWHNGGTGGYHAFIGFDPKTRRGIVLLASTSTSHVDRLATAMYQVLDGAEPAPPAFPTPEELAPLAGTYDLMGTRVAVEIKGKRLYVTGPGEPPVRLLPLTKTEFFIEPLQAVVIFEQEGDRVVRLAFGIGGQLVKAPRVE